MEHRLLGPPLPPPVSHKCVWGGAPESAFPVSSQLMLTALVQEPHFENHRSRKAV